MSQQPSLRDDPPAYPRRRATYVDPPAELLDGPPIRPLAMADIDDNGTPVSGWLITGYELAKELLSHPDVSAERWRGADPLRPIPAYMRENRGLGPGWFLSVDPPDHSRYRRALARYFTPQRAQQLAPRVEEIVDEQLDALEEQGRPADLMEHLALPIPTLVICEILGIPYEDRPTFQHATTRIVRQDPSEFDEAMRELVAYFDQLVKDKRRREPAGDVISDLLATDLTDEEIAGAARLLHMAGHETTVKQLGLGVLTLLQTPDQFQRLREDDALIPTAVEELLRFHGVVNAFPVRVALKDFELGGVTVRAGDSIAVSVPAANRDEALVDRPHVLDVGRQSHHLAFGHGIHFCIGRHLAKVEIEVAYRKLFQRFPRLRLAVPPEEIRFSDDTMIYGVRELPVTW